MHVPVLLNEVLEYLNVQNGIKFIDGTAGDGGILKEILKLNIKAEVLGIDLDQTTLEKLQSNLVQSGLGRRAALVHGNFAHIKKLAIQQSFHEVDGVVLDLGLSSFQLDNPSRGFSFQLDGPLDMRFDTSQTLTAAQIVNKYPEDKLIDVFVELGEEKFSKRITHRILDVRKTSKIATTGQLVHLIVDVLPRNVKHTAPNVARRIFQALRIEVNQELENLKEVLPQAVDLLKPGGRLAIISFHSLEDRIVKWFLRKEAGAGKIRILTKKPIIAGKQEQLENPRSKAAKLRAAEKL